jgi:AcrR family transcriptional regulator
VKKTKPNILSSSLALFNKHGYVNVRLQHIADEAFISIGNLAYHFENKGEILHGLYKEFVKLQKESLNDLNIVPLFENMDAYFENLFDLQTKYSFFYQDMLEIIRSDALIAQEYRKHIKWEKDQYLRMIDFNISRGAFYKLTAHSEINDIADMIWWMVNSWMQHSLIIDTKNPDSSNFKNHIWTLLSPYFSKVGQQEYEQLVRLKMIPL